MCLRVLGGTSDKRFEDDSVPFSIRKVAQVHEQLRRLCHFHRCKRQANGVPWLSGDI